MRVMNVVAPMSTLVAVPDGMDYYAEYPPALGTSSVPLLDDILGSFGGDSTLKSFGQTLGELEKSCETVDSQLYSAEFPTGECC